MSIPDLYLSVLPSTPATSGLDFPAGWKRSFPRLPKIQIERSNRPCSSQSRFPVNIKLNTEILQLRRVDPVYDDDDDGGLVGDWMFKQAESSVTRSYSIDNSFMYLQEGMESNILLRLWDVLETARESDREVTSIDIDLTDVSFGEDWERCYEPSP